MIKNSKNNINMTVSTKDKVIIQDLARQVAEIAAEPINDQKRDMWIRLNRLERVRPLIHVQAIDESIWSELLPSERLKTTDSLSRQHELELRKKIYCWEYFRDDRVVDDVVVSPLVVHGDIKMKDYGIKANIELPKKDFGAYVVHPVIVEEDDINKIQTEPDLSVDWDQTERQYEQFCELYDGILRVEKRGPNFFWFALMDNFIKWRGIEQMYMDLVERPEWLHAVLERMTQRCLNTLEQLEQLNVLSLNNDNTRLGSGGYGFSDELPQDDFDGKHVRLKDMWARASTQIFTDIISPETHDEFAVQYEKRLLDKFGLSCYGCCEPLDKKMHIVRQIKNLRRVSMSPWVDVERAAKEVGKDYIYTYKPNPSIVSMHNTWDLDLARQQLRDAFEKTRDNIVEVNLQDLHTVHNEPHRLTEWTEMAMQLAEEYAV